MTGILERALTHQYGPATVCGTKSDCRHQWNAGDKRLECTLFMASSPHQQRPSENDLVSLFYGDSRGGFLLGDSLKVSLLEGPPIFCLYKLEELQSQEEVKLAHKLDPHIFFLMDSENIWFYGIKDGELFVYDSEVHELSNLGPVEASIQRLLAELAQT